jgi:hypothetical protein
MMKRKRRRSMKVGVVTPSLIGRSQEDASRPPENIASKRRKMSLLNVMKESIRSSTGERQR